MSASKNPNPGELLDKLADLYPREEDSRRVVREAGVDERLIHFSTNAANNWSDILRVAQRQNKLSFLITVACKPYPDKLNELIALSLSYFPEVPAMAKLFKNEQKQGRFPIIGVLIVGVLLVLIILIAIYGNKWIEQSTTPKTADVNGSSTNPNSQTTVASTTLPDSPASTGNQSGSTDSQASTTINLPNTSAPSCKNSNVGNVVVRNVNLAAIPSDVPGFNVQVGRVVFAPNDNLIFLYFTFSNRSSDDINFDFSDISFRNLDTQDYYGWFEHEKSLTLPKGVTKEVCFSFQYTEKITRGNFEITLYFVPEHGFGDIKISV